MKVQQAAQASQINDVQQAATQTNAKIADVSTDVGGVKTHLSATDAELQKTISDLKSARGDLGVQSGLIATNATELSALRLKGERNYTDIKLTKKDKDKRFADITLTLKSVDAKRNKYTVDVMADDKHVEKKDKSLNEPVQFYTAKGGHTPYEIVINQVGKDQIVGYLATPKDSSSR
jgi:acetolactate synthase small subunit